MNGNAQDIRTGLMAARPGRRIAAVVALAGAGLLAGPATAARVLFDDFDAEAGGATAIFQTSLTNFDVGGYIDVIAPDNTLGYDVDSSVVDIGGGLTGGVIRTKDWYRWEAGDTVSVSFLISGNRIRPGNPDVPYMEFNFLPDLGAEGNDYVDISRFWATGWYETEFGPERLGAYYFMYGTELAGDQPWVRQTLSFTPLLGGSVKFLFGTLTGGGYGPLLDDFAIDITPSAGSAAGVPEPRGWAMLIAGFGLVGASVRRRRQADGGVAGADGATKSLHGTSA